MKRTPGRYGLLHSPRRFDRRIQGRAGKYQWPGQRLDAAWGAARCALPTPRAYYTSTIEGLRERQGNWATGLCPFHPDHHPSFSVNLETGAYRCHAVHCAVSGSNIVSFVSALLGICHADALAHLKNLHGNGA